MRINRKLIRGAGIAIALMVGTGASADEVLKAVLGHEAFFQRCVDDQIAIIADNAGVPISRIPADLMNDVVTKGKERCDIYYRGINVCMEESLAYAIRTMEKMIDDTNTSSTLKGDFIRELAALNDLAEGRVDYCDVK
jgi:hypothetical protein